MNGSLTIYKIKPLKGPDRLLRVGVIIKDALDIQSSVEMLGIVVESILLKYHGLIFNFPVAQLLDKLPENPDTRNRKFGEFLNGALGLEMLFMYRGHSVFNIRHYSPEVEFQRHLQSVDTFVKLNSIDMNFYTFKHTLNDLRNGVDVEPFLTDIKFLKAGNH